MKDAGAKDKLFVVYERQGFAIGTSQNAGWVLSAEPKSDGFISRM